MKYRVGLSLLLVLWLVSLILPNNAPPAILLYGQRRPVWLLDSGDAWLKIGQDTVTATGWTIRCSACPGQPWQQAILTPLCRNRSGTAPYGRRCLT